MSARDTKRDLTAGPHDTLRDMPRIAQEPDDTSVMQEVATKEVPAVHPEEEKTGARKKFDPYRFQANTVPPGMRAELIHAEPEEHPSDLMQDTLPPNRSVPRAVHGSTLPELGGGSGFHRTVRRPGLRPVALVSLSLLAIALAVLVIVTATRPRVRYVNAPPAAATAPSIAETAPSIAEPSANGAVTPPSSAPEPNTLTTPNGAQAPNVTSARPNTATGGGSAPKERRVNAAAPRELTTPKKTVAPKSEPTPHSSRIRKGPDLESPLMP